MYTDKTLNVPAVVSRDDHFCQSIYAPDGVEPSMAQIYSKAVNFALRLREGQLSKDYCFLDYVEATRSIDALVNLSNVIQKDTSDVVVLGTGGSSLGAQTLAALMDQKARLDKPTLHFPDNLSEWSFQALLDSLDFRSTHFLVISKSGETFETLTQFILCLKRASLDFSKKELSGHFSIITQASKNPLRQLASHYGIKILEHNSDLGGRFSCFSKVGLLPAIIAGINVRRVREGGKTVLETFTNDPTTKNSVIAGAVHIFHAATRLGRTINVTMPYDSRLDTFTKWHQQLTAESLGKNGGCITPMRALGPIDQHSQMQLFLAGPSDKFFTIITTGNGVTGEIVDPELAEQAGLEYLSHTRIQDIVNAESSAVVECLVQGGHPTRVIQMPKFDERALGALMMHFLLETILIGHIMGINPFGQPAIEIVKSKIRGRLLNQRIKTPCGT